MSVPIGKAARGEPTRQQEPAIDQPGKAQARRDAEESGNPAGDRLANGGNLAKDLRRDHRTRAKGREDQQRRHDPDEIVPPTRRHRRQGRPQRLGFALIKRPAQDLEVAVHPRPAAMLFLAVSLEEIGRDHRRDHARHRQRHQHRNHHGQAEVLEELPRDARHQADRQEHRDDREGGGNHGQANLVRRVDRSLIGAFAHPHVAHDVLDLDDRVIDQHPRNQAQRQQRERVEGKAHQVHEPEGRDRRERDSEGGDYRGTPVAQEEEHHDHGQNRAFDHGRDRAFVLGLGIVDRGELAGELDPRVFLFDLLDLGQRAIIDRNVRGTAGAGDAEGHHRLAIGLAHAGDLAIAVRNPGEVAELDRAAIAQRNIGLRKFVSCFGIAQHADRLARSGDFGAATGGIDIELAQLGVDLAGGNPERLHPRRIERDRDLAIDAAAAVDRSHAGHVEQPLGHRVIDEPRELLDRHVVSLDRPIGDRVGRSLGLDHLRLKNAVRQFAARLVNRVLDLVDRLVDVFADLELDHRLAAAFRGGRADRLHPGNGPHRGFDALGDLGFDLGRRSTRLGDRDDHHREFDVRIVLDLHLGEAHHPGQHQADKEHDRHHRVADRPGRDIAEVHRQILS